MSFNRQVRSVDSTFDIEPNRMAFSLSVSNTNTEGSEDVKVECDLFLIEEGIYLVSHNYKFLHSIDDKKI